jgi:hypothetical protein
MTGMQPTKADYEALRLNRLEYRWEMQRAINCISAKEKKALVADWKSRYDEEKVQFLINMAKNKKVLYQVANWNIDNFVNTSK